jgi:integrase
VDLAAGVIRLRHGWDDREGEIELKSNAGRRNVPIPSILRDFLTEHLARAGHTEGLMFELEPQKLTKRADDEWEAAGLERITLHECRHTFASPMIAAGVNAKALQTFMGHANISITLDRYGHLMPGSEDEAAGLLDAYLDAQRERAEALARSAPRDNDGTTSPHSSDPRRPETTTNPA